MSAVYVIGDIHGQYEKLIGLLRGANLVGDDLSWIGRDAALWFMGDFFDRGPDGIGVVELVMRLQLEALGAGGHVQALLGNHEPLLLAAHRFGQQATTGPGGTFVADWERNGGMAEDLRRLKPAHVAWLTRLPAMAHVGDRLFAHADALFYTRYGSSVEEVNRGLAALLQSDDAAAWDRLLDQFSERNAFVDSRADGAARSLTFLRAFGGRQFVHGHTPISGITGQRPEDVRQQLIYARGRCVNVDGGMYQGGPGFVYQLPSLA